MYSNKTDRWEQFVLYYTQELEQSTAITAFIEEIKDCDIVALLTATIDPEKNYLLVLKDIIDRTLDNEDK